MKLSIVCITAVLGMGSAGAVELPGPVVDTAWLAMHKNEVQIVDVRSDLDSLKAAPKFETDKKTGKRVLVDVGGHIPDSLTVDFSTIRADQTINGLKVKYMLPSKESFQHLVQEAGIRSGKPVVLVAVGRDVSDVDEALRMYWELKVYGDDHVAVLDGGMAAWLGEGREFSIIPTAHSTGDWMAKDARASLVASSDEVANASSGTTAQLVDARNQSQYFGLSKKDNVLAFGHIAGAKSYAPELLLRNQDGALKFYPANTYRNLLAGEEIKPDAPTITYCNTGHLASGAWFVMSEIVGDHSVKLYDGSMHLWTNEKRPVAGVL